MVAEDRKIKKHISFVWKALTEHYFKAQFKLIIQITKRRNQIRDDSRALVSERSKERGQGKRSSKGYWERTTEVTAESSYF